MLSKIKRLAAVVGSAGTVAALFPAGVSAAPAPCRAVTAVPNGDRTTVVLEGHYSSNRVIDNVVLTCHVVQGGAIVASSDRDPLAGPVAVLVGAVDVPSAPFTVCHTASIRDITGWGSRYDTNCP